MSKSTNGITRALEALPINSKTAAKSFTDSIASYSISNNAFLWGFGVIFFILLVVGITIIIQRQSVMSTPKNVERIQGTQLKMIDAQLAPYYKAKPSMNSLSSDPMERCLVNYAPLTVMNPGYMGPAFNGVYDEANGVRLALKAGARCFVLPIDYHEDDALRAPLFAEKRTPCLLMRDEGGVVRSLNSGSIQKVAQALADAAFSDLIPTKNDPLIIILYFVKTPTPQTKEYLRYLSSVAKQLAPLSSYHLGQTPEGVYNRQGRQNELLYSDIGLFERKLFVFSNADTSLFRNTKSVGLPSFVPREDLDFWVHLRLFKQSEAVFGVTQMADDKTFVRGMVETVSYYTMLPQKEIPVTMNKNKITWAMALSRPGRNPTSRSTEGLLTKLGVQCIPLCIFNELLEDEIVTVDLWKKSSWRFKPSTIRFRKPEPAKPLAPSPQLNAQQGKISSPTL